MLRSHTLDPGWFGHPATTTMYVLAVIDAMVFAFAVLTGRATSATQFGGMVYANPAWIVLPGRVAMVLFALGTIWLTWSLARQFFGPRAGLAAALLLALNPIHITWSQIIRSDMMACVFMLLCLQSCAAIAQTGRQRDYGFAALWLGLAIATKWPFALSGLAIGTATLFAMRTGVLDRRTAIIRLAGSGIAAICVLFVVSPYLLIDYPTVLKNLQGEGQAHHLGANGGSFWYNLLWYIGGPIHTGFGVLGLVLIALGSLHLFRHRQAMAVLAPVAVGFLILFCSQRLIWERWVLPLMPIGAIIAAAGLVKLADLLNRPHRARWVRWAPVAVLIAVAVPLGARAWADGRARMNDTRQLASAWARQHIPAGSRVLIEHNAFDMVGQHWQLLFPMGKAGCVDVVALIHGRASYAVIDLARDGRSNVDYGTMAPERRADCHADFAILTQYDRYRQERDLFPDEYAAYGTLLAAGSVTATFRPLPGKVGGPVVTIIDMRSGHRN
jgi:4-amino-4-deoxy-L-arabinose transferase-like glycosyltransferase